MHHAAPDKLRDTLPYVNHRFEYYSFRQVALRTSVSGPRGLSNRDFLRAACLSNWPKSIAAVSSSGISTIPSTCRDTKTSLCKGNSI